jgi:cobyrinic acid a,c-diamide synthase
MYLARRIRWGAESHPMVGVLPVDVVMEERPQGRGYVRLAETGAGPWPALPDGSPGEIAAHEFHYSRLAAVPPGATCAYRVLRGTGIDGERDGLVYRNLLASYVHLRNTAGNRWTDRFVAFVRACRARAVGERAGVAARRAAAGAARDG